MTTPPRFLCPLSDLTPLPVYFTHSFVLVERLSQKDAVVVQALTEKLQLFADMAASVAGLEDTASRSRLLLRGDASDLQQGEALLKGALTEGRMTPHNVYVCVCVFVSKCSISSTSVENLQNLLQSGVREDSPTSRLDEGSGSGLLPRRADTFGGYDSSPAIISKSECSTIGAPRKSI